MRPVEGFVVRPVAYVRCSRTTPVDDGWDLEVSEIELTADFGPEALVGLDEVSHLDVITLFHLVDPDAEFPQQRRPRGDPSLPEVGIFAQRNKDRPNRLGLTTCRLLEVHGTVCKVEGLDAVDGTPILDLKPHFAAFDPRGPRREPTWAAPLLEHYWR